ncbi:MAG: hypothetical protein K0Q94_5711, partial [Paenibacillus sp.]|nr:hypothetical protein [Paenibacillus sp.]
MAVIPRYSIIRIREDWNMTENGNGSESQNQNQNQNQNQVHDDEGGGNKLAKSKAKAETETKPGWSRRRLLASIGAAGATFAAAGLLGRSGVAYGNSHSVTESVYENSGRRRVPDLLSMNLLVAVTIAELRAMTSPEPDVVYYVS